MIPVDKKVMSPEIKELLDYILCNTTFRDNVNPNVKLNVIHLALKVRDEFITQQKEY